MFKLHRHKSDKFGERVEFKFSHFQAFQVPRGWDRLIISIASVETGKTITKTSKAVVRNGSCQWSDTLKEFVWISQDDASKELEECPFKLVVSMGSARSGILGEAVLNLTEYTGSKESGPVSLPLKKCNHGTMLQLKVQGFRLKASFRDGKHLKETTSHIEDPQAYADDLDNKSDDSDNIFNRSAGSSSSNHLVPDEPGNRSFSASGSHRSSDSGENYITRASLSPKNSLSGGTYNLIGRQDSTSSQNSITNSAGYGDDTYRSNPSSFNSKVIGSQWQETNGQSPSNARNLRHSDSSKEFLEAAQETIEELRGEARMWEKTARKFKGELEALRKEFSDQSKHQAELDMELSAACSERDGLKLELEQLKSLLDESEVQQAASESSKFQAEDLIHKQKELEDEVKFQKESHANLVLQLKKSQESNIELVSILQELEETIEKQREEIASFASQTKEMEHQMGPFNKDIDLEVKKEHRPIVKEEKVNTANVSETGPLTRCEIDLKTEVTALKQKIQELERDCAELTEENLDLLFKLKESTKDNVNVENSPGRRSNSFQYTMSSSKTELEQEPERKEILSEGVATEPLTVHFHDLEKKCTDLELDLQFFKNKASDLGIKLQMSQLEVEEKSLELTELHQKLEGYKRIDWGSSHDVAGTNIELIESGSYLQMSDLLTEIHKQLQKCIAHVKIRWFESDACVITESDTSACVDYVTEKEQAEAILQNTLELNKLLGEKISDCKVMFQYKSSETNMRDRNLSDYQKQPRDSTLKELDSFNESCYKDVSNKSFPSRSEMEELEASLSLKEEEIATLNYLKTDLESMVSKLRDEKVKLQENLENALRESSVTSKCLDDARQDFLSLTSSMESQVLANKMLERKLTEFESGKCELEFHLSELEQENVQLTERISGLEAQLRYLTNEKESMRLELENSRSLALNLKNEIGKLEADVEAQKTELKQKLQETQKRSSEAREESEFLKRSHSKLQATVESLIDECSSLQKLNGDLRRQKQELHEKCAVLEVELSKSQEKSTEFCSKVDCLEAQFMSLQKDTALKEKSLISQIEAFYQEHKELQEKLSKVHIMLDKMDEEKMNEVETLQREVAHLTAQISSTHDEREQIASDAVREVSSLRAEKVKLEANLQEVLAKVKSYETELLNVRHDSETKLQGLIGLLDASKQSEEMLMEDIKHMRRLMEDIKSREDKVKRTANELELKLKSSGYEREQLMEEISSLKIQLQKMPDLQEEILALKSSLDETKFEKVKLENSLHLISSECEEVKAEKDSLLQKNSSMQKALSDGEDARLSKVALEEKLLRLECDLTAGEALYAHDAELKNEVNRIKRANSQYQRKIQCLEEEKDEFLRRVHDLEKELKLKNEEKQLCQSEAEMDKNEDNVKESETLPKLDMLHDYSKNQKHLDDAQHDEQGESRSKDNIVRSQPSEGFDLESKIQKLEAELAEALQTNSIYQKQLQNFMSESGNANRGDSKNSLTGDEARTDDHDSGISSLESELKDMQDRYFQMSLRYAEVEAQREELVMKLKSVKKEKRWFS